MALPMVPVCCFVSAYALVIFAFTGLNPIMLANKLLPASLHLPQNSQQLWDLLLSARFQRSPITWIVLMCLLFYVLSLSVEFFRQSRLSKARARLWRGYEKQM